MTIGQRLQKLRLERKSHLTQKEVAEQLGLSNVVLNRYEKDERKPDPDTITKLATYYRVTTDYILGRVKLDEDNLTPTPPEELRTFYRKIGQLSPESREALEKQIDHYIELENKYLESKRVERDSLK